MKKTTLVLLSLLAIVLASCNGVSPETANAFKGEYWMETTSTIMNGNNVVEELPRSTWTPVSIYEKGGALYVQTELLGAPDLDSKNPQEVEGYKERPDFAPRKVKNDGESGIENIETTNEPVISVVDGLIVVHRDGIRLVRTLPIKVKSGSETVLNLEAYKPVKVQLTSADGTLLGDMYARYEYGPMVKDGDVIKWDVTYKDDWDHSSSPNEFDHVIHKNTLYKK